MKETEDGKTARRKRRVRQRANRKYGNLVYQEIVGGDVSDEFIEKYGKLTKKQIIEIWVTLTPGERLKYTASMSKTTIAGITDYTPYNAITGNDAMSAGRVTNPVSKLPGGFNTKKG